MAFPLPVKIAPRFSRLLYAGFGVSQQDHKQRIERGLVQQRRGGEAGYSRRHRQVMERHTLMEGDIPTSLESQLN